MTNEDKKPEGFIEGAEDGEIVRFKPSESRMRLYLEENKGNGVMTWDVEGMMRDIVSLAKAAGWSVEKFGDLAAETWASCQIIGAVPDETERN